MKNADIVYSDLLEFIEDQMDDCEKLLDASRAKFKEVMDREHWSDDYTYLFVEMNESFIYQKSKFDALERNHNYFKSLEDRRGEGLVNPYEFKKRMQFAMKHNATMKCEENPHSGLRGIRWEIDQRAEHIVSNLMYEELTNCMLRFEHPPSK